MPKKISTKKTLNPSETVVAETIALKPARKAPAKKRVAKTAAPILNQDVKQTCAASIDYPQAGEIIVSPQYTLRITAPEGLAVEVSIDDGAWQPCRYSVGHWWFDWSNYPAGRHTVCARVSGTEAFCVRVVVSQA
jgi:hypothetical protein